MKRKLFFPFILTGLVLLASCEKDETKVIMSENPTAPSITGPSSGASIVLTNADSANNISFTWSATDVGFSGVITYTLQMDKAGNEFNDALILASGTTTSADINVYSLDSKLLSNGYPEDVAASFELRVRAIIAGINSSPFADTLFSETVTISITPYLIVINYPKLYVPGSYQGWDPSSTETTIASVKSNDIYEGYLYFPDAGTQFKFTTGPNWDVNYGDNGADGTLDQNGDNIVATDAGYYKINVDMNSMTYSILKTVWGIIGSSVSPYDWSADQKMTYDVDNKVWTITADLKAGEFKFRANDGWDLNYGDTGADGKLDQGGDNIAIAADGNYTITLDLSKPVYTYKVKKN